MSSPNESPDKVPGNIDKKYGINDKKISINDSKKTNLKSYMFFIFFSFTIHKYGTKKLSIEFIIKKFPKIINKLSNVKIFLIILTVRESIYSKHRVPNVNIILNAKEIKIKLLYLLFFNIQYFCKNIFNIMNKIKERTLYASRIPCLHKLK